MGQMIGEQLSRAAARGLHLAIAGGKLQVWGAPLTDTQREWIRAHLEEITAALSVVEGVVRAHLAGGTVINDAVVADWENQGYQFHAIVDTLVSLERAGACTWVEGRGYVPAAPPPPPHDIQEDYLNRWEVRRAVLLHLAAGKRVAWDDLIKATPTWPEATVAAAVCDLELEGLLLQEYNENFTACHVSRIFTTGEK